MRVCLRYFEGCPNWQVAEARLRQVLDEAGESDAVLDLEVIDSVEAAQAVGFRGSPTILIDGVDPFEDRSAPIGLACRLYRSGETTGGAPSLSQLRAALGV